ncbi:MAG TPA: recombinase family protein [Stellaceae bacterium]|nr:recombinase family protein [Stellaceae bacterium]
MARKRPAEASGEPAVRPHVSYVRVSTDAQGASGLGLEAQRAAIERYLAGTGGKLVAEYREVESGKRNDRPQLAAALAACRARRAVLIIAKLDRLSRNFAFLANLMESEVEFVACDNPHATKLTIRILAAVAQDERERTSERTKAALAVVRRHIAEHGTWLSRRSGRAITRLGNTNPPQGNRASARAASRAAAAKAEATASDIMPYIAAAQKAGCRSLDELAAALTARGIKTPRGKSEWRAEQVRRIMLRAGGA